jgi:agmatinase
MRTLVPAGSPLLKDPLQRRIRLGSPGDVAIVGIPWDWSTSGRPGARFAPQAVRKYLYSLTDFSPYRGESLKITFEDLGDVSIAPGDLKLSSLRIVEAAKEAYKRRLSLFLGGDHSITRWTLEPLASERSLIGVLVMDAHYDMRSVEEGLTSGSWLWDLLSSYKDKFRVTIIGVQDYMNPEYLSKRAKEMEVNVITRMELLEDINKGLEAVDKLKEVAAEVYYISIDMDHLCEACAPGVNSPSPLGMTQTESLRILVHASRKLKPKGVDVTEIAPPYDVGDMTSRLAAFLLINVVHEVFRNA